MVVGIIFDNGRNIYNDFVLSLFKLIIVCLAVGAMFSETSRESLVGYYISIFIFTVGVTFDFALDWVNSYEKLDSRRKRKLKIQKSHFVFFIFQLLIFLIPLVGAIASGMEALSNSTCHMLPKVIIEYDVQLVAIIYSIIFALNVGSKIRRVYKNVPKKNGTSVDVVNDLK